MRYRIVTNGHVYKIQEKGFLFGWNDYSEEDGWGCVDYPIFSTLHEARMRLSYILKENEKTMAEWRTEYEVEG